jgi:trk system potassium uptake protein TrkH
MLFSISFLPPVVVSVWYADGEVLHFLMSAGVTLAAGLLVWLPVVRHREELSLRDGYLVVALFWAVLGVVGSLPLILGVHLAFTDAVFESVSGFTTTGATVIVGLDQLPRSILYYQQQLQWLGGLGVIVLAVAILPMLGVGGMQLFRAETSSLTSDEKITPRITQTARALWVIYLGMTVVCAVLFWLAGMTPFDAIAHSFSTVATGGFSTHDASLGYFDSVAIELIASVFMLLGATSFALHFMFVHRGRARVYVMDAEFRAFLLIVLVAVVLVAFGLWWGDVYAAPLEAVRYAGFQVVSVITSTGFGTATFAEWPLYIPLLLAAISFVGGCVGSTAGGMKVVRIVLLAKQGLRQLKASMYPRAMLPVKLGVRSVPEDVLQTVWGYYSLYIMTTLFLTLGMMATGLDLESSFGAVVATINLLGPGLGEVASTFVTADDAVKWMGVFAMLVGRLEVVTLFVLFTAWFWRP